MPKYTLTWWALAALNGTERSLPMCATAKHRLSARLGKAKVRFQIIWAPLAHIQRLLAPNPMSFGKTPGEPLVDSILDVVAE